MPAQRPLPPHQTSGRAIDLDDPYVINRERSWLEFD